MDDFQKFIRENARPLPQDCLLAIVCNVKNTAEPIGTYGEYSTNTEYLSDDEFDQITQMAAAQKIAFRIFTSEKEFITYLFTTKCDLSRLIVYNSAQSGTGAGRKSLIPSICHYLGIRHTGSDAYRVSLCRDKWAIFSILRALRIDVPQSYLFFRGGFDSTPDKTKKYIAKPLYESASIGIDQKNVFYGTQIPAEYLSELERTMRQPLIVQEFISGYELEVPIVAGKGTCFAFPPVCLHMKNADKMMGDCILDYQRIYFDDYAFVSLDDKTTDEKIMATAKQAAQDLQLSGLCRVDFRLKEDGTYYVTDVSTNPHFIQHSSVNYAFKRSGFSDAEIFRTILTVS